MNAAATPLAEKTLQELYPYAFLSLCPEPSSDLATIALDHPTYLFEFYDREQLLENQLSQTCDILLNYAYHIKDNKQNVETSLAATIATGVDKTHEYYVTRYHKTGRPQRAKDYIYLLQLTTNAYDTCKNLDLVNQIVLHWVWNGRPADTTLHPDQEKMIRTWLTIATPYLTNRNLLNHER